MISLLDHLLIIEGLTEFRSTEVVTFFCGSGIPEPTITHLFHECLRIELFRPEPFPFLHLTFLHKLVEMQMVFFFKQSHHCRKYKHRLANIEMIQRVSPCGLEFFASVDKIAGSSQTGRAPVLLDTST